MIRVTLASRNSIQGHRVTRMKYEFFMVTYRNDLEFAWYTMKTMKKFGSGDYGITILVPYADVNTFQPLAKEFGCTLKHYLPMPGKEFLHHMVAKCQADIWCPDADVIIHIDADCIFGEPFTPEMYMDAGKPILVREHYDDFIHHPCRPFWRKNVNSNLGFDCEWETMVRHPNLYWRDLYPRYRKHIEDLHKMPFEAYVLLQREEFPYTFCEFPTLGAFVLKFEPERYRIVTAVHTPGQYYADAKWRKFNISPVARHASGQLVQPESSHPWRFFWQYADEIVELPLRSAIRYFWSRKGVTPEYRKQIEAILSQ